MEDIVLDMRDRIVEELKAAPWEQKPWSKLPRADDPK